MSLATPYDMDYLRAAGGLLEPTAENFPCCKMFYSCDETSGLVLAEKISGNDYTLSSALTSAAGIITLPIGVMPEMLLNTPLPVAAKSALLFAVTNLGTVGSIVLSQNVSGGGGIMALSNVSANRVGDGTNTATGSNATTGANVGTAIKYVSGITGEGQSIESTTAAYTAASAVNAAPGDLTSVPTLSYMQISTVVSASKLALLSLFVFDAGIPANLSAALTWMTAAALNNVKCPYPGWRGLA